MNLKRQNDVIVLGLEGAGKSLLIRQLKLAAEKGPDEIGPETNPTAGFDTNKIKISSGGDKKTDVHVNEVGSAMISTWYKFISNSKSIIVSQYCLSLINLNSSSSTYRTVCKWQTH